MPFEYIPIRGALLNLDFIEQDTMRFVLWALGSLQHILGPQQTGSSGWPQQTGSSLRLASTNRIQFEATTCHCP